MEHIPQDDILQLSLNAFKTIGESMATDTTHTMLNLYRFINVIIMGIILSAIVANLFQVEVTMYIQTIEGLFSVIHIFVKYMAFLYYKYDIEELLKGVLHFWKRCDVKLNKKYNDNINRAYRILNTVQYYFSVATIALSNVSNAINMSSWYQQDTIVIRAQLIMMMRAQSQKFMSAGGLMDMNIDAFGSVIRKIFSFYAILRNVLN